jgi:hypothetical protein
LVKSTLMDSTQNLSSTVDWVKQGAVTTVKDQVRVHTWNQVEVSCGNRQGLTAKLTVLRESLSRPAAKCSKQKVSPFVFLSVC